MTHFINLISLRQFSGHLPKQVNKNWFRLCLMHMYCLISYCTSVEHWANISIMLTKTLKNFSHFLIAWMCIHNLLVSPIHLYHLSLQTRLEFSPLRLYFKLNQMLHFPIPSWNWFSLKLWEEKVLFVFAFLNMSLVSPKGKQKSLKKVMSNLHWLSIVPKNPM